MNKKARNLLIAFVMIVVGTLVVACSSSATVSGTVTYRERIALPDSAVVYVRIEDISKADAAAQIVGEQVITNPGQVPIAFEVEYDPTEIQENHTYNLRVRIEDENGKLLFISDTHTPVITQGAPTEGIEMVVVSTQ